MEYWPHTTLTLRAAQSAARSIKIVDEEIEQAVVQDAQTALRQAEFVYFLGFGFDERNLSKLNVPHCLQGVVRGTA